MSELNQQERNKDNWKYDKVFVGTKGIVLSLSCLLLQAFTSISKMQLMERDATGVLACNVAFLVIMNGECLLVIELGTDVFHVWNL